MERFFQTQIPIEWNDEESRSVAELCGNEYRPELTYKRFRVDLSLVFAYEEGFLATSPGGGSNSVIIRLNNGLIRTVMATYEEFTTAFDTYWDSQQASTKSINYKLSKA